MPLQDITALPTPPARTNPPDTFITRADAFIGSLPGFVTELNTLATQLEATAALINVAPAYADSGLYALTGLTPAADKVPYWTGTTTSATMTITSAARSLLDDTSTSAMLTTLGVSAFAKTILDDATSGDVLTTLGLSADGKSLVTAADYSAMRTALSLVPGTNVQAYDSDLAAIAALATTTFGRSLLTAADAAAAFASIAVTSSSLIENDGYIVLANGLKLSWATISVLANTTTTWSPPVTYSTWIKPVIGAWAIPANYSQNEGLGITAVSTSSISIINVENSQLSCNIFAIGV